MRNVVIQIICDLLQPLRKISQTAVRLSIVIPLFVLVLVFWCDPLQFPGTNSSLRSWAGRVEDKSCSVDVEDELLPELADKPGTLRAMHCHEEIKIVNLYLLLPRLFALLHWPLPQWGSWIFAKCPVHLSLNFFFAQHVH